MLLGGLTDPDTDGDSHAASVPRLSVVGRDHKHTDTERVGSHGAPRSRATLLLAGVQ